MNILKHFCYKIYAYIYFWWSLRIFSIDFHFIHIYFYICLIKHIFQVIIRWEDRSINTSEQAIHPREYN